MRIHVRLLSTVVATGALLVGCGSSSGESLEDWYSSGGEKSIKALSEASSRVNEVSVRPMDTWGAACKELLTEVAEAEELDAIPSENAEGFWKEALTLFEDGGNECVAGAEADDQPRASAGIREVQKGIGRLSSTTSMIAGDLKAE
ncbi:hypothetical protein ACFY8O_09400 [Streptomyces argenteolus]|uniref:Small secreted protein n=1 Tax=Streptomyces argenteolus TaxID=67274 RepID=A0ABW6X213_9ACTN